MLKRKSNLLLAADVLQHSPLYCFVRSSFVEFVLPLQMHGAL